MILIRNFNKHVFNKNIGSIKSHESLLKIGRGIFLIYKYQNCKQYLLSMHFNDRMCWFCYILLSWLIDQWNLEEILQHLELKIWPVKAKVSQTSYGTSYDTNGAITLQNYQMLNLISSSKAKSHRAIETPTDGDTLPQANLMVFTRTNGYIAS